MWMGSPQGSNQNDQYNVEQQSEQHAGNSAIQKDHAYGNCDTSGNCNVNQHINQNGNSQTELVLRAAVSHRADRRLERRRWRPETCTGMGSERRMPSDSAPTSTA